jgi:hypothetical protein
MERTLTARSDRPRCLRADCVNVAAHKGLCQSHYNEQRNQGRRCAILQRDTNLVRFVFASAAVKL